MKPGTEKKILSGMALLLAAVTIAWIVIGQIELQRMLDSAAQAGLAVDVSADPQQRNLRLTLALILGGIADWSRKGTKIALALFGLSFLVAEFIGWVVASQNNPFDRTEAQVHICAGAMLILATLLWLRRANHMIISALAPLYLLLEYLFWYLHTLMMWRSTGAQELNTSSLLNRVLYGAHWWHIVLLVSAVLMIIWQTRIGLKHRGKSYVPLQAV